jgi:hypothetical protein
VLCFLHNGGKNKVNSEELEMSLRTEFESHLRDVYAGMRQEFSEFQTKVETEFEKHKSQLDTAFQEFSARLNKTLALDAGFKDSVVEHLRLARDEGARITATAIAEAEEMAKQSAPVYSEPTAFAAPTQPLVGLTELRDGIKEITAQDSQGTILKSLVQHAEQFTPRGAFFIIKNEHFVGWKVFNKEGEANEEAVREIYMPVAADTVLGESVRSLSAVESTFGTYGKDQEFLTQLGFTEPEKMYAIPLVARGRGVAVLYADYGTQGEDVNIEALETLVRVAGLTVEVLASSQGAKPAQEVQPAAVYTAPAQEETETSVEPEQTFQTQEKSDDYEPAIAKPAESFAEDISPAEDVRDFDYTTSPIEDAQEISVEPAQNAEAEKYSAEEPSESASYNQDIVINDSVPTSDFQFAESLETPIKADDSKNESKFFEPIENVSAEIESVEPISAKEETFSPFEITDGHTPAFAPEPAVAETVAAAPVKSRFSDRNVDLPIEVSEDERRLHNDARRFARLLVSEIKLYNEQKVKEGRDAQDLYDRLREAIDRSRDMYDKRVQPPVAAKFDYFHYEIVNTLAEGEATKLGGTYPGAAV